MDSINSREDFIKNHPSTFYDYYIETIVAIKNAPMLLSWKFTCFVYATVICIVVIIAMILRFITVYREDDTLFFIIDELIRDNEKALRGLHQASDKCYIKRNSMKCIELVIYCPHFINKSLPTSKGITPFHRVCYRGNYNLVEFMINYGADLSLETDTGENALQMVIDYHIRNPIRKNFDCLDLLYSKGCSLKRDDKLYKQFLFDAIETENEDLLQWLRSHDSCEIVTKIEKKKGDDLQL